MSAMSPASSRTCRDCSKTTGDILQSRSILPDIQPDPGHNPARADRVTGECRVSACLFHPERPKNLGRHLGIAGRPDPGKRTGRRRRQRRQSSPDRAGNRQWRHPGYTTTTALLPERTEGRGYSRSRHPPAGKPESPYMHARTAVADGTRAYLGSISLSPDSPTYNREVGLILDDTHFVRNCRINLKWTSSRRATPTDSSAPRLRTRGARRGGVRSRAPPRARRGRRSRRPAPRAGGRCAAPPSPASRARRGSSRTGSCAR